MGKHERQLIEEAEKIIVKILKNRKINNFEKRNPWLRHALAIVKRIQQDFPKITLAHHLGNRYDYTGDILIASHGKDIFIEVKMSESPRGIGTKANISQDALTENCLFTGNVMSWSRFRKEKKHDLWVNDHLDNFDRYPNNIFGITNQVLQKEEKARYLRELKKQGDKKAVSILNSIHKKDKREKIEYLNYLQSRKQRKEMIKRFFILITLGIHRKEELFSLIQKDNFFQEAQKALIYYSNSYKNKLVIRREDTGERIKKLLNRFSDFKITFPKGSTHCKIVGVQGNKSVPLLQIVLHWKNIAQGIKTPCLNIFDLTTM